MTDSNQLLDYVYKQYDDFQLSNINLALTKGEIVGVIGPNGSGKTSLLKVLAGQIPVDSGRVSPLAKEDLAFVFDQNKLLNDLTLSDYQKIFPSLFHHWESQTFHHYLDYFGLPRQKKLKQFSKGMIKKLNISLALSHQADYLLLDEITSDLDPFVREEVLGVVQTYVSDRQAVAILTSHILEDVLSISDKLLVMKAGTILVKRTTSDFQTVEELKAYLKTILWGRFHMKGLLIKDLLLMKNKLGQGRILLLILAYILISALVFTDLFFLLNIFLLFILMNTQTHVYVQDQESGFLEFLHITTDLSVRQTVLARFLSSGIFSLGLIVFFFLLFAGFNLLAGLFTWLEMLVIFAVLLVFSLAYILLSMPFLYLFLENGFVILLIFLAILLVLGTTLIDILGPGFLIRLASLPTAGLVTLAVLLGLALFALSFWLSLVILNKKMKEA